MSKLGKKPLGDSRAPASAPSIKRVKREDGTPAPAPVAAAAHAPAKKAAGSKGNDDSSNSDADEEMKESKPTPAAAAATSSFAAADGAFFMDTTGTAGEDPKPSKKRKRDAAEESKSEAAVDKENIDSDDSEDSEDNNVDDFSDSSDDDDASSDSSSSGESNSSEESLSELSEDDDDDDDKQKNGLDKNPPMAVAASGKSLTPNQIELNRLLTELAALTPAQRKAIPKNHPLSKSNIGRLGKEDREIKRQARDELLKMRREKRKAKRAWQAACEAAKEKGLPEPPRSDFKPKPIRIKVRESGPKIVIKKNADGTTTKEEVLPLYEAAKEKYAGRTDVIVVPLKKKKKVDPRVAIIARIKAKEVALQELAQKLLGHHLPGHEPPKERPESERDPVSGELLPGKKSRKKKPEDRHPENVSSKRLKNKEKQQKFEEKRIKKLARRKAREEATAAAIAAGLPVPEFPELAQAHLPKAPPTAKKLARLAAKQAKVDERKQRKAERKAQGIKMDPQAGGRGAQGQKKSDAEGGATDKKKLKTARKMVRKKEEAFKIIDEKIDQQMAEKKAKATMPSSAKTESE